jgi:hypothetical protein
MPDAELDEKSVDRSDLDAGPPARIANTCCSDVIVPVGPYEWKGREPLDDLCLRLRASETLQQFLQHKPCSDDYVIALQRVFESLNLGLGCLGIASKSQRPDTGIDQDRHFRRERSAL